MFKTSKAKDNKLKDIKLKDGKETKSLGIGYNTPYGETPGMTPELQISKEELIKISKEPVANYYIIWGISPMSQNMGGTLPEYTQSYHTESI